MYDCRTQGGHFFVSSRLTVFSCHHCSKPLCTPATTTAYRCILEKCGYLACDECATTLNESLHAFHQSRDSTISYDLPPPSSSPPRPDPLETGQRPRRGTLATVPSLPQLEGNAVTLGIGLIEVDDDVRGEEYELPKRPFTRSAAMAAAMAATRQVQGRVKTRVNFRPRVRDGDVDGAG